MKAKKIFWKWVETVVPGVKPPRIAQVVFKYILEVQDPVLRPGFILQPENLFGCIYLSQLTPNCCTQSLNPRGMGQAPDTLRTVVTLDDRWRGEGSKGDLSYVSFKAPLFLFVKMWKRLARCGYKLVECSLTKFQTCENNFFSGFCFCITYIW